MFKVKRRPSLNSIASINVTPLVDVSLVLVIIFMVTVPMLFQPLAELIMPKAFTGTEQNRRAVYISYSLEKKLYFENSPIEYSTLGEKLTVHFLRSDEKIVIIRADEKLPYEEVNALMAIVKTAGANKIIFATEYQQSESR